MTEDVFSNKATFDQSVGDGVSEPRYTAPDAFFKNHSIDGWPICYGNKEGEFVVLNKDKLLNLLNLLNENQHDILAGIEDEPRYVITDLGVAQVE